MTTAKIVRCTLGLLAVSLLACGQSHPSLEIIGGYPSDTRLDTLSGRDDFRPICEWALTLREGELERYWCGADLVPVADEPLDFPKAVHSWSVDACINNYMGTGGSCADCPCPTACERTVADLAACIRSRDARPCFRMPGQETPECARLFRCHEPDCTGP